jgi:hypothetical protein
MHGWHTVVVTDEDGNHATYMVCEELEDLLTEIEELLEDEGEL